MVQLARTKRANAKSRRGGGHCFPGYRRKERGANLGHSTFLFIRQREKQEQQQLQLQLQKIAEAEVLASHIC
jgi:hypothetical protein